MVNLNYKQVGLESIEDIIDLAKEIWIPAFRPYFSETELHNLFAGMYAEDVLRNSLKNPNYMFFFIYGQSQNPVGYLAIDDHENFSKLDKIYVKAEMRGLGLGSEILKWVVSRCQFINKEYIELRVNRMNQKAISLYKRVGFIVAGEVDFPGPEGSIYQDYIMKKGLF